MRVELIRGSTLVANAVCALMLASSCTAERRSQSSNAAASMPAEPTKTPDASMERPPSSVAHEVPALDAAVVASDGAAAQRDAASADAGSEAGIHADAATEAASDAATDAELVDPDRLRLETRAIAAQAGYYATAAPGQAGVLTGTDLGWAFAHRDRIWVMFGDSWWIDPVNAASVPDDALGQISLTDFPDGPSVDAFVREHPAPPGQPAWRAAGPTMTVAQRGNAGFAPVISMRDGEQLPAGIGYTPVTGFSNGRDDGSEAVFAIFYNYEPVECVAGSCEEGFSCDTQLSRDPTIRFSPPCVVGSSPSCRAGAGLCQDRETTVYDASSNVARALSVVLRHNVGVTTSAEPLHFEARAWDTVRFSNATSRTVSDFDPERAGAAGNDYTPAHGNALPRAGVFVWGRPGFGGIGVDGRDAQLYLLWAPMPEPDADQRFDWAPRYFTGVDAEGRPQFSPRQVDARPLDLDAATPGDQPEEVHDVVGQMGISWLPSLRRFVMFYGGEGAPMFGNPIFGDDIAKVRHDPHGSLFVRFASQPWGPWTAPRELLRGGDHASDAEAAELYGPGGIMAHNNCRAESCARFDPAYLLDVGNNDNGVLYGASIIDAWTTARDERTDLYWFLSTWNPYQVVLMKTSIVQPQRPRS